MAHKFAEKTAEFNASVNTLIDEIRAEVLTHIQNDISGADLRKIMDDDTFNALWNYDSIAEYEALCYFIKNNRTEEISSLIPNDVLTYLMPRCCSEMKWDVVRWYKTYAPRNWNGLADWDDHIRTMGKLDKMIEDNDQINFKEAIDIFGRDIVLEWCAEHIRALNFTHTITTIDEVMRAATTDKNYALCEWLIVRFNLTSDDYGLDESFIQLGLKSASKV